MSEQLEFDRAKSPFHRGERLVQARLGARDIEPWARKVVRDHLPRQHRDFYSALPFLVVAARDRQGRPWVTLLEGPEGFVHAPDDKTLVIGARPGTGDALQDALGPDSDMGILGIDPATRRRNRVNGKVGDMGTLGFSFRVDQTFGNCPQYIREREWHRVEPAPSGKAERGQRLTAAQQDWIAKADTFFIGSGYRGAGESPSFGMDASHRGGEKGFVQVLDDRRLRFPDYAGNNHFNTIGNLILDPRAGYLFVDFASGGLLQLTGRTTIDWDSDDVGRVPGARRLITLEIDAVVERSGAMSLRWSSDGASMRSLRLVEKLRESDDVTSFIFESRDGGALPDFAPGQHLPIELDIPGADHPAARTYSLSNGPSRDRYRISVKRESKGLVSRYLHDHLNPGAIINSRRPAGDFVMTCNGCPLVLISAGVGVTPMVSMLQAVAEKAGDRPVWFVHGARDGRHHPLAQEIRDLTRNRPNIAVHVAYSRPLADDKLGMDYDSRGRIDGALLSRLVDRPDAHYFLCGPIGFMAEIQVDLERQGAASDQIHTESFGPAK